MIENEQMRMPWRRTFLLGFGFFGMSLLWPLYDSFVPIFLRGFGLSNRMVGFGMTVDNYVNMFIQPWVGQRSDRTHTRFGRRFPYILVGAPLAALGVVLIPLGARQSLVLLLGAMFLFTISMALFRSPTVALLGDMFPPVLRSQANGIINFMGVLAAVLAFVLGGLLFEINTILPFALFAVAMLVMLVLLMFLVREPVEPYDAGEPSSGMIDTLQALRTNPDRSALLILLALLAWSVGLTALQAFWTLFGVNELGLAEGAAAQLLSFYPLAGLLFAIPGGYLGTYLGRRRTILICLVAVAALLATFLFIPATLLQGAANFNLLEPATWFATPGMQIVILLLLGAGAMMTVVTVNILPLLFDNAPEGQIGAYTGLYYLFGSIASILGPPLGGLLVDLTGSYRTIFVFAPLWVALGLLLLWMVREPTAQRPISKVQSLDGTA
ncbi:MAG: MFS transporter [Chloroflexota bacterium]|nr:MFS transporter [Chloroflexota bacterium]